MPKILCCLVLLVTCSNVLYAQRKIIDVHFHTRSAGDYGPVAPANPVSGNVPKAATNEEILSQNLSKLKKYNIVKAICSGTLQRNEDFIAKDPARFISSLEFPDHQNNPLPDTATFTRLIKEKRFLVLGELGLQYEGQTLVNSVYEPYLSICERYNIPVAIHTGEAAPNTPFTCCPKFTISSGRPLSIEPVLKKHPRLKVQLMHMGYPFLEETKALLNVYPNVYADISAIDWLIPVEEFHSYLKSLTIAGFSNRLMYGSDQMIWDDAIGISIKNVESAAFLSAKQKDDIFYNNAVRFYEIK